MTGPDKPLCDAPKMEAQRDPSCPRWAAVIIAIDLAALAIYLALVIYLVVR